MVANGGSDEPDESRPSADDMDEQRRQKMAYEYLCRLDEARLWMADCLKDELPETVQLEESLCNGVVLARLAHFFAPSIVSENKIFDKTEKRYTDSGLHFRHTDNIVQWMRAMQHVGLPNVFVPETTDVYDKKNMPKCVFCLHALAMYLNRKGLAPPMKLQSDKPIFPKSAIDKLAGELHGIVMPNFSKIGGMLEDELPDDTKLMHQAVRMVNEAIRENDADKLLLALQKPEARLRFVVPEYKTDYLTHLHDALQHKQANAQHDSDDMYALLLTRDEIQAIINQIYESHLMPMLQDALASGDRDKLATILKDEFFARQIDRDHIDVYIDALAKAASEGDLTRERVQHSIDAVNALLALNDAIAGRDRQTLLRALHNQYLDLDGIRDENCLPYFYHLAAAKTQQRLLSRSQIQEIIDDVNAHPERQDHEALIVFAARNGDTDALRQLLTNFHNVRPDLLAFYADALATQTTGNDVQAIIDSCNKTADDKCATALAVSRLNLALAENGDARKVLKEEKRLSCGLRPEVLNSYELPLKDKAKGLQIAPQQYQRHEDLLQVPIFTRFDGSDVTFAQPGDGSIAGVSHSDILAVVNDVNQQFDAYYAGKEKDIVLTQAQVRGYLAHQRVKRHRQKRRAGDAAATKIQRCYRSHRAHRGYQDLMSEQPTLGSVCLFAPLLDKHEQDCEEEIEIEALKKQIAKGVKNNRAMEDSLRIMDIKIGLLIKNRLTADEVHRHGEQMKKEDEKRQKDANNNGVVLREKKGTLNNQPTGNRRSSLIVKSYIDQVEAYQHLFYHLQIEPQYLSRLIFAVMRNQGLGDLDYLVDTFILPLFNHAAQRREEFLFLQLLQMLFVEELKKQNPRDVKTAQLLAPNMVLKLSRHTQSDNAIRNSVRPLIDRLCVDDTKVNVDPIEIYKYTVGEVPVGMTPAQAAEHHQVEAVLAPSMQYLERWSSDFVQVLDASVTSLPYCIRYLARLMRESFALQHPELSDETILKAVGEMVYDNYMYPIITTPEPGHTTQMSSNDKKKLIAVAKLLQFASHNKGYDDTYLAPLNAHIKQMHGQMSKFIARVCEVKDPKEQLRYDLYEDLVALRRPTVYFTVNDVLYAHRVIVENERSIIDNEKDELVALIEAIGRHMPSAAALSTEFDPSTTQVSLHLQCTHKSVNLTTEDDTQSLFLVTKKRIVELLHYQTGDSLRKILDTPALSSQEAAYTKRHDQNNNSNNSDRLSNKCATLEELKTEIKHNLHQLEERGRVSNRDDYQSIISAIAQDVRSMRTYRRERVSELQRLRSTLSALEKKERYYQEQTDSFQQYTLNSLKNLAPNSKPTKAAPKKSKKDKENKGAIDLPDKGDGWANSRKSIKYSGEKLVKKGLLAGQSDGSQYVKTSIEIDTATAPGVFDVTVRRPGSDPTKTQLRFQELLQAQYECRDTIDLQGLPLNVNELIYVLNKKFLS